MRIKNDFCIILAFDTYYYQDKANTVCLSFENRTESDKYTIFTEITNNASDYIPGEFYKREMPCILSLLQKFDLQNVETIIVDGFVFLDDNGSLGLGGHLYKALNEKVPVIGVAKSNFATINRNKRELYRGESKRPLYITSIGIDLDIATKKIRNMNGKYRIPTLLKELDKLTKVENGE